MASVCSTTAVVRGHVGTLQEYAVRIYTRFPQLFVTLGRDDLPAAFDLSLATTRVAVRKSSKCMVVELRIPQRDPDLPERPDVSRSGRERESAVSAVAEHMRNAFTYHGDGTACSESAFGSSTLANDASNRASPFTRSLRLKKSLSTYTSPRCVAASTRTETKANGAKNLCQSFSKCVGELADDSSGCQDAQLFPSATAPASQEYSECDAISRIDEKPIGQHRIVPAVHVDYELSLSAASLARLSEKRLRSASIDCVDPGKPTLSYPGSHCQWDDQ
eukprot:TRINITY_DN19315_c0_g3_i1.p1 TRINITY_DN19315_c0_g3~~TRINITY_DN19315_c0_g3_i1.p1  ORF type:complete len:300 (-),score=22.35 TRINITY_DN19315_c0_g3_i1:307-1134(-)